MAYDNKRGGNRNQSSSPVGFKNGEPVFKGERKSYGNKPEGKNYKAKTYGDKPQGEKPFGDKPYGNKPYGDKPYGGKSYGNKPYGNKPYGGKSYDRDDKPHDEADRRERYGKPRYNDDKPRYGESKPRYGENKPRYNDDKPRYGENKPRYNDDKPHYGENKPRYGENKPRYNDDKPRYNDDKPRYGESKPRYNDDKPRYGENKPRYGENKPRYNDDKPRYGENKPRYNDDKPRYNKRDAYDEKPKAPAANEKAPAATAEDELPYLVMGRNAVREALKSGRSIDKILVQKEPDGSLRELIGMARDRNIRIDEVMREKLDELCRPFGHGQKTGNHQGIVAQVPGVEYCDISDMLNDAKAKGEKPFIIVLDGIEDPHNLGSIIRSAVCAGAHGIIIPKRRAVSVTAAASKASAGAVEYCRVARVSNINGAIDRLKDEGMWIAGADMGGKPMGKCSLSGACALVIGNEGDGISRLTKEKCDFLVSIPMTGKLDSLNAAVAAAIIMFEKRRQDESAK